MCIVFSIYMYIKCFKIILVFLANGKNQSSTLTYAWLGLSDRDKDGTYKWIDKNTLSYKRYVSLQSV